MTSVDQHMTLYKGQDAIIDVTITTDQPNIDGWAMTAYWRSQDTKSLDMTVVASVPTPGTKVARLTITDTDTEGLVIKSGNSSQRSDWQLWRTDDGSESPLSVGVATVYRTLRP